jgi:hypothetical protein
MQSAKNGESRFALWTGGVLAAAGVLTLVGYGLYYFVRGFFGSSDVPLPIQVAVPTIALGMLVLLIAALVDRRRQGRRERIQEIEY